VSSFVPGEQKPDKKTYQTNGRKNWVELIGFLSTSRHTLFRIGIGAFILAIFPMREFAI